MVQEESSLGQRERVERLVGRLIHALHASTHRTYAHATTLRAHILPLTNVALNKDATLSQVVSGAWDSCGRQLVTGGVDKTANVLHLPTLTHTLQLDDHGGEVTKVAFNAAGTRVITAGEDGYLRLWDAHDGRCVQEERGHDEEIFSLQ
nr:dynein assembly factor with WDR repeat domains 1-like [Cherax quadricarinatus]